MSPTASAVRAFDVVVMGAGPAGCAAASVLACGGRDVLIVPGRKHRRTHAESLPPSGRKPLEAAGLAGAIRGADFLPAAGNAAAWASGDLVHAPFPASPGLQVERDRFDRRLLEEARSRGAEIAYGGRVRDVAVDGDDARVVVENGGLPREITARYVLDASGRAGVLARRGLRQRLDGPETIAVIGRWRGAGLGGDGATLVESFDTGWAWYIPVASSSAFAAVMLDPDVTTLGDTPLGDLYHELLGRTRHIRERLAAATPDGLPFARVATPYRASRYADGPIVLVGDAGSFLDPLSSFGIKKALASGWLAALAVNASLGNAAMASEAFGLFERRERLAEGSFGRMATRHYALGQEHHGGEFWRRRTAPLATDSATLVDDLGPESLPELAPLLHEIRDTERLRWRASPDVRTVGRAVVRGQTLVLEDHLVSSRLREGIRFFGSVRLPDLLEIVPGHDQVPDLFDAYSRALGPVPLPEFLGALAALKSYGLVEESPRIHSA